MKVLVAVDFGDASLEALRQGRALAHALGAELASCHVLPGGSELSGLFPEGSIGLSKELTEDEESARRALAEHARARLGLELSHIFIERGSTYAEIVRRAESWGADYIALGSHGRTGLSRVVLGSVAERVVRTASCPVLTVRTPAVHHPMTLSVAVPSAVPS